jgi:hypothetical protein
MGETINSYKVLVGNLKEMDHKKDLAVDGNKLFKYIMNGGNELDLAGSGQRPVNVCLEHSNYIAGSIRCREIGRATASFSRRTLLHSVNQLFISFNFQSNLSSPMTKPVMKIHLRCIETVSKEVQYLILRVFVNNFDFM